jgi:hypothetical protein
MGSSSAAMTLAVQCVTCWVGQRTTTAMLGDKLDAKRVHLVTAEIHFVTANFHGLGIGHGSGCGFVDGIYRTLHRATLKRHAAATSGHAPAGRLRKLNLPVLDPPLRAHLRLLLTD